MAELSPQTALKESIGSQIDTDTDAIIAKKYIDYKNFLQKAGAKEITDEGTFKQIQHLLAYEKFRDIQQAAAAKQQAAQQQPAARPPQPPQYRSPGTQNVIDQAASSGVTTDPAFQRMVNPNAR